MLWKTLPTDSPSTVSSTAVTLASQTQPLAHQALTAKSVLQESSHLLVLALVLIA